jgi:hypothetical protein
MAVTDHCRLAYVAVLIPYSSDTFTQSPFEFCISRWEKPRLPLPLGSFLQPLRAHKRISTGGRAAIQSPAGDRPVSSA